MKKLLLCVFLFIALFAGVSAEHSEAIKVDGQWYIFYRVTITNDTDSPLITAFGMGLKDGEEYVESTIQVAFGPTLLPGESEIFVMMFKVENEDYKLYKEFECETAIQEMKESI